MRRCLRLRLARRRNNSVIHHYIDFVGIGDEIKNVPQMDVLENDTHRAIQDQYDVVLCMYHDQGHIPVKVYGFEESITANLGLPFVRTSVDHGTAFDIAGQGVASHESMLECIRLAVALAQGDGLSDF